MAELDLAEQDSLRTDLSGVASHDLSLDMTHKITHRPWPLLITFATLTVVAACSRAVADVPCDELELGSADSAVLILTDGRSPALERTTDRLIEDPERFFSSEDLGIDSDPGIVVVATTGAAGDVVEHAAFNLAGVGADKTRRDGNARNQAACLAAAAEALSAAPETEGERANTLRALPTSAALLQSFGSQKSALVIHGFGRSDNDGFIVAETDLSETARSTVLGSIESAGIVPTVNVPVVFVAPSEGVSTGIGAAAATEFTTELCTRLSTVGCVSVEVLK